MPLRKSVCLLIMIACFLLATSEMQQSVPPDVILQNVQIIDVEKGQLMPGRKDMIDGPNPMWDGSVGINGVDDAPAVIDSLIAAGVDFLKVYSLLPRDIYFALSKYANEIDFPFVGHVPFTISPSEAASSGMKSQEHLLEILMECSDRQEELKSGNIDYGKAQSRFEKYIFRNQLMMESYSEARAKKLCQIFKDHNTWHTPTLSMWYKNAYFETELPKDQALYQYLPDYLKKYWTTEHNDHLKNRDLPEFIQLKKELYQYYLKLVKTMNENGVRLLAGTDMGANPLCFAGIGVHNELQQLVVAGLSPAEALKTATINPALFLEIEQDFGTVGVGKIADLLVLEQNPLEEIGSIRSVHSVVKSGVLYDKKAREKMLEEIAVRLD